jgi:hypothetical protein
MGATCRPGERRKEILMRQNTSRHHPGQKIGRDAKSGQFIPVREAQRRPSTTTVETLKRKTQGK